MIRSKLALFRRSALVALLPALAATSAFAQDKSDAGKATTIDEVVVTALNPTHNINLGAFGAKDPLDVPITIESHTSQEIENIKARTITDILANDPSVQTSSEGGAYDHIRIRGFSIDWGNTMRVDGLSLAPYQDVPFENVQRVDLLKGPSGFLYGFNSPGGTVNYIVKRPTATPFFKAVGEVREYGGKYASVDTSAAVGDDVLGYRMNLAYEDIGDFSHSGDVLRYFGGLNLDWRLADKLVFQINTDAQSKSVAAQPLIGLQPNGDLPPEFDQRTLLGQPWLQYKTRTYDIGGRIDYTINPDWFVVAQANRSSNNRDAAFVDVYSVAANGDILDGDYVLAEGQSYDTTSAQAFVSGKFSTGPVTHDLVSGLSYRHYKALEGGYFFDTLTVGNIFHPVYAPEPDLPPPFPKNVTTNRQASAFASDFITLSDQFQVLAGLRYIEYFNQRRRVGQPVADPAYKQNSFVPSLGLLYKPRENLSLYASYSRGLEQGGFAPITTVNAGTSLNPIESTQYEAGVKTRLAGVTFSLAAFQISKGLEFTNAANVYVQDGMQRHRGVEFSADGKITPGLSVIGGIAYLNTVQLNTIDPTTLGKKTVDAPTWQANLNFDYHIPVAERLFANVGVYYVGSRELDAQNTAVAPSYWRVDAGVRDTFSIGGQEVTLRVNVKNLLNQYYWVVGQEYTSVYPGIPRTAYLSLDVAF